MATAPQGRFPQQPTSNNSDADPNQIQSGTTLFRRTMHRVSSLLPTNVTSTLCCRYQVSSDEERLALAPTRQRAVTHEPHSEESLMILFSSDPEDQRMPWEILGPSLYEPETPVFVSLVHNL